MEPQIYAEARTDGSPAVMLSLDSKEQRIALQRGDCRARAMDVSPRLIDGRIMVPLRWLAEGIGVPVYWDAATGTVFLRFVPGQPRSAINPPAPARVVPVQAE